MNSSSFDQILRRVLLVPILAVLVGAGALVWQMHSAAATVSDIELNDDRIAETLRIEKLIIDQETGLRGYQTTRDVRFLDSYRASELQLPDAFAKRRRMMLLVNRRQEFAEIEQQHRLWEDGFADPLIASIEAGATTSDVDLNMTGKRRMDDIRQRLFNLNIYTEQRRGEAIQRWRQQVRSMTVALVALAIVIGVAIGLYTRRLLQKVSSAYRESHEVLRQRAEQTFRSEQKLRTTLRSIGESVLTCDVEGRVDSINACACDLLECTEAEAHGKPLAEILHVLREDTRAPIEDPFLRIKRMNNLITPQGDHAILIRADGTELFIDGSGAPIRDKRGTINGAVLVFRDITLERKSQQALIANEKLAVAGRLAATIAHEIHNPLDSVSNLLFLMDGNSTPEETQHFLQLAKSELARVTQISRAMLSLHRESKAPVPIDLREMLLSILLLLDRRFHDLGVNAQHSLPEDLIVQGFPAELRQVFTNLLTNAAEASGEGGSISLAARRTDRRSGNGAKLEPGVSVSIEDHGPGVPEEVRSKLFQPFFTTKGEQGTGLGLWVSQGIIHKHGGAIEFASSTDPVKHGTTVSVFLAIEPVINAGGD